MAGKEAAMAMQVLVEPLSDGTGYRASTGAPLHVTATGPTPDEALAEVGRQVAEKLERGAQLYNLPGIPPVRRDPTPLDPELEKVYWQAVEEHREQVDREDRLRLGITDAPPVA
jgi:hypothetical protein